MDAKTMRKIGNFAGSAGVRYQAHLYLATDLFPSHRKKGEQDEHEYVDIVTIPLDDALDLFLSGREFTTSYTLVGLLLTERLIRIKSI